MNHKLRFLIYTLVICFLPRGFAHCPTEVTSDDRLKFEVAIADVLYLRSEQPQRIIYQDFVQSTAKKLLQSIEPQSQVGILAETILRRFPGYPTQPLAQVQAACQRAKEWLAQSPDRLVYDVEDFLFAYQAPLLDLSGPLSPADAASEVAFARDFAQLSKQTNPKKNLSYEAAIESLKAEAHGRAQESIYPQNNPHGLSRSEWLSLLVYTGGYFEFLNKALRNHTSPQPYQAFATTLNQALHKIPRARGTLYRGAEFSDAVRTEHIEKYQTGAPIVYRAFTSTSFDRSTAEFFGTRDFAVIISKNARVINSFGALAGGELEALFSAPSKFFIRDVQISKNGDRTYYLEELD